MHRLLLLFALAGCPPPTQYLIADVTAGNAPVADAMVAADCHREYDGPDAALRTDATGRARLPMRGRVAADRCSITVAKPGYPTVEADGVNLCTTASSCPAIVIELSAAPYSIVERPALPPPVFPQREYARPPVRQQTAREMEVAQ
jgi:hypothetical protein